MPSIFNVLPGIEVSAGAVSKSLADMWRDTAERGGPAPGADDVKATQVNLVLHLGFATTAEDATRQFQVAVRFSQRYPCRVVVLCPLPPDDSDTEIRAKIYGECHLGKSKGDTRCCEFVMLSYPQAARQFLENQVSVCLSTDLPLYYWAHRFSSSARLNDYQYLLRRSKRVLFDSALVPADAFTFPWPRPDVVRDLVHARLLPVRQSLGQFLSGYRPASLVEGLKSVQIKAHPAVQAEGNVLLTWAQERLIKCGAGSETPFTQRTDAASPEKNFEMKFEYQKSKRFTYRGDLAKNQAVIEADFGSGAISLPTAAGLLNPEAALGEAMFF